MIPILIVALFSLALFHWAYESAIAPSVRLGARYRLFALRDELRNFVARESVQLTHPAVQLLEESINSTIEYMREINFGFVFAFNSRFSSDDSFKKRVEHRKTVVESYDASEFQVLRKRYEHLFREITILNCGGWFIYLIPIAFAATCWEWLRRTIVKLSFVPSAEFPSLSRGFDDTCAEPA